MLTDVMPLDAGFKNTDMESAGILSFTAVHFVWSSFRELVGSGLFETGCCPLWPRLAWNALCSPELMPVLLPRPTTEC